MASFWKKISYIGIDPDAVLPHKDVKKMIFFNQVLFVVFFVALLHVIMVLLIVGVMAIVFVFAMGNIVMYLWNWILPDAIGANEITFWKAIGLFVLTRILFGGFKSGRSGHRREKRREWKEKWMSLSEDDRKEFKEKWQCGWK